MRIVLASGSPRRRELLGKLFPEFEVIASQADERTDARESAGMVEELSARKAEAVLEGLAGDVLVIGADTVVALGERILGKPADLRQAMEMLSGLEGRDHTVYTGVTLLERRGERVRRRTFHEGTRVHFYPMSRQEIEWYAGTGEPMDKAGAYGIQGLGARFVRGIEGDYDNVVGLPLARLYQEIKAWGEIL